MQRYEIIRKTQGIPGLESEVRNPGAGKPGPEFRGPGPEGRTRGIRLGELEGFIITILKNDDAIVVFWTQV